MSAARRPREGDFYQEGAPGPARERSALAPSLVLRGEHLAGRVLAAVFDDVGTSLPFIFADPDLDPGISLQVLHPVGAFTAARDHVRAAFVNPEPDLNIVQRC